MLQAQSVQTGEKIVSLNAAWPCIYGSEDEGWYDCPIGVEHGKYVLGPPITQPDLSAEVEFTLDQPTRYFLDGVARCDGCYNVLASWQFTLLQWDGSAWQAVWIGFADHIERCTQWDQGCRFDASAPEPGTLELGRYKLWAQSSDGAQGFRLKTEINISLKQVVEVALPELEKGLANCQAALASGKAQIATLARQLKTMQSAEAMAGGSTNIVDDLALLQQLSQLSNPERILEALDPQRGIVRLKARIAIEQELIGDAANRCAALAARLAALKSGQGTF